MTRVRRAVWGLGAAAAVAGLAVTGVVVLPAAVTDSSPAVTARHDGPSASRRMRTRRRPCGADACQAISTPGCTRPAFTVQPSRYARKLTSSHACTTACGP